MPSLFHIGSSEVKIREIGFERDKSEKKKKKKRSFEVKILEIGLNDLL